MGNYHHGNIYESIIVARGLGIRALDMPAHATRVFSVGGHLYQLITSRCSHVNLSGVVIFSPFLSRTCSLVLLETVFFGTCLCKTMQKVSLTSINGIYSYIQEIVAWLYVSNEG